jgi:DNA-binding NtrC family response regulator
MLLWVDLCCGARGAAASAEFARHCDVRPTDQQYLWTALSLASTSDVICFDFEHPDMSCLKFMTDTKAKFPSVPIIMLMSQQSADVVLWALRARIFDVLMKPLTARAGARSAA